MRGYRYFGDADGNLYERNDNNTINKVSGFDEQSTGRYENLQPSRVFTTNEKSKFYYEEKTPLVQYARYLKARERREKQKFMRMVMSSDIEIED